jgi:DNA recombination protein RmuC
MATATFLVGIVLALALGAALGTLFATLWARSRPAPPDSTRPLADSLQRIELQLRDFESQRQHAMGGLEHQLSALSRDTVALSQALRSPNARGRWGELTLRRVAELSGMVPYCDFVEQSSGDESSQRPDLIVKLPGGRTLAVDAKVPLAAYLEAEAAADPAARKSALDRHAQAVLRHAMQLGGREYWAQFQPAPEMVVMFLAGDHFLSAALERDAELLERALAKKVLLATPVTLISVLKGVAYGWRQERLAQNAVELRRIAGEFQERIRAFADFYADSGRHLARAVDAYNRSAASWESRLLPSLKRMRELGAGAAQEAAEPPRIDVAVREPAPPVADALQGVDRPS